MDCGFILINIQINREIIFFNNKLTLFITVLVTFFQSHDNVGSLSYLNAR